MDENSRAMVDTVIQTNAIFSHPENIIIAMIHDHRLMVRRLSIIYIQDARSSRERNLHEYIIPSLVFDAE